MCSVNNPVTGVTSTMRSRNIARHTRSQASRVTRQPLMAVAAGLALSYAAALLIHRRWQVDHTMFFWCFLIAARRRIAVT